jgi:hypothetical protein
MKREFEPDEIVVTFGARGPTRPGWIWIRFCAWANR